MELEPAGPDLRFGSPSSIDSQPALVHTRQPGLYVKDGKHQELQANGQQEEMLNRPTEDSHANPTSVATLSSLARGENQNY